MADQARIDDLRRRVQKDPASIAFAQLAEELRRSGQVEESVEICRAGLAIHNGYLSARVTLGRALLELNQLEEARTEFEIVLKGASENLAAIRGLAEVHHRSGNKKEALRQYRAAFLLAPNDPELEHTVEELSREIEPLKSAASANGLSLDDMQAELLRIAPAPSPMASAPQVAPSPSKATSAPQVASSPLNAASAARVVPSLAASATRAAGSPSSYFDTAFPRASDDSNAAALKTVAALEQFLAAIHVARAEPRA